MQIKRPKGTEDITPAQVYKWQYVEALMREICALNGYREIRTPAFEHTELFHRGVGETTDVVQKEMYTFEDKANRSLTLKPEGTATAVRAFIENGLFNEPQPTKLFYFTPCFRYEKPQSGRLREHHQFGIEAFGSSDPSIDAEIINLAMTVYKRLGVSSLQLKINSIGCPKCRVEYNKKLKDYLSPKLNNLCETCQDRFNKNPLRIIDCKEDRCQQQITEVPLILDHICEECSEHFEQLKVSLDIIGLEYTVDPRIVRGLDYYTKTAFEIVTDTIGAQGTVCGGGRYDGLIEQIDGPSTPGVGFGMGIERLLIVLEKAGIELPIPPSMDLFIIGLGDAGVKESIKLIHKLRDNNIKCDKDYAGRSLKAQMKYANKMNARYITVIGEDEINNNKIKVKNMENGSEEEIQLNQLLEYMKNIQQGAK
ncbi:MAG: histidine--tRNA ligase [Clostridia bacterium]|jgi:histidyl-tRNA synthetase|nr:histidine--tRNA ligase [Clostridia bacterium]